LFASNPTGSIANENKISFKRAANTATSNLSADSSSVARLSRWLSYDATYNDRVVLTANYTPLNGMAFSTSLTDPDNSKVVTFSTSGGFTNYSMAISHQFISGSNRATLTFQPQTTQTFTDSGNSDFGRFLITDTAGSITLSNEPFRLTIIQTAPYAQTLAIDCTLSGTIVNGSSFVPVTFPTQSNNLGGALYVRGNNPINSNASTPISVSVTAPQPTRLTAIITGFGPRAAQKQLQLLVNRYAFDFLSPAMITLRSADNGDAADFAAGSSSVYTYSGFDNAGGFNLPAVGVTGTTDYTNLIGMGLPGTQIMGSPANVQQVAISTLPSWLQTADAARALVIQMRVTAQNAGRYFTADAPPASFGTVDKPIMTFVDGDCVLPTAGGAGLLVVTGSLTADGNAPYKGLVLVLGGGTVLRNGGGNGESLGSVIVARFGTSGDFLAPSFESNGSGTSSMQYDSDWVRRALASPGPRVMAVGEF